MSKSRTSIQHPIESTTNDDVQSLILMQAQLSMKLLQTIEMQHAALVGLARDLIQQQGGSNRA